MLFLKFEIENEETWLLQVNPANKRMLGGNGADGGISLQI